MDETFLAEERGVNLILIDCEPESHYYWPFYCACPTVFSLS